MPQPKRSATASIRGYLYQTVLAAQAWVTLAEGETLVVEGDEDFDRVLKGRQTSVQVKHRSDTVASLDTPSLLRAIRGFAGIYAEKGDSVRFVYVSTQSRKAGREADHLANWQAISAGKGAAPELVAAVAAALEARAKDWGLDWQTEDWRSLVRAVRFEFDRGGVGAARQELSRLLGHDSRAQGIAQVAALPERILDALWDASSQDEKGLRRKTRQDLGKLIDEARLTLASWAQGDDAKRLVGWLEATETLEELLPALARPLKDPELPTQLLDARYEVVPFLTAARQKEIDDFTDWCDKGPLVDVRVVVGSGGTGKTRLMLELCKLRDAAGWHAGFLDADASEEDAGRIGIGRGSRFIVVDYAETRLGVSRAVLKAAAQMTAGPEGDRCRVVLLAREQGPWFEMLPRSDTVLREVMPPQAKRLDPLVPGTGEARAATFRRMMEAFAIARNVPLPESQPKIDLDAEELGHALLLTMAALEATRTDRDEKTIRIDTLLDATLEHEEHFWIRRLERAGIAEVGSRHLRAVEEAAAALTLLGHLETDTDAEACVKCVLELCEQSPDLSLPQVVDLLGDLYSARERGHVAAGIQPDLLGEHVVARVLFRRSQPALWLDAVLRLGDAEQIASAFTVLGRLGARLDDADRRGKIEGWLRRALETDFDHRARPAFEAAVGLGSRTAFASVAKLLAELLKEQRPTDAHVVAVEFLGHLDRSNATPVSLRELAVSCGEIVVSVLDSDPEAEDSKLARTLNNLSVRLGEVGRREDALAASREAVNIYRQLAAERPDAFLPDLARSLNNLGNRQSAVGRREDALAATQKAVDIYRQRAAERPDAFLPELAMSLNNLGNRQSALGRREDGLAATQEPVDIYRQLAAERPDAFLPDLATSLSNLGNQRSALGRREDALAATREAVDIYRRLAAERPDAFLPDLAMSLNNLGNWQSALGRRGDALAASQEAVGIYRRLAAERPDAFLPDLAMSLNNLGADQSALGRREDALASTQEAVDIRRQLAAERPDAFLPDLAMSLNNLGAMQSELGRRADALAAGLEAVDIYRQLAAERPDAFLPHVATSLGAHGLALRGAGRLDEAMASLREGLATIVPAAARLPEAFRGLTTALRDELVSASSEAGVEPDAELLAEVRAIYGDDAV